MEVHILRVSESVFEPRPSVEVGRRPPLTHTSDRESLKKSLIHVDEFLKSVGQRIQTERSLLQRVSRRQENSKKDAPVKVNNISKEDYSNLLFADSKRNETLLYNRKKDSDINILKGKKDYSNFLKAIATLNEEEINKGTTKKLSYAVNDLQGLVDTDIHVKSNQNSTKLDSLRKIQEALRKSNKGTKVSNTKVKLVKSKRDNDENEGELEVFGEMDFPEDSSFPGGITTKGIPAVTGGGQPPEILDDDFIKNGDMPGPKPDVLTTPSTTTDVNELLLDPEEYGFSTTHKSIPTYGDLAFSPFIPSKYLTTTPGPDAFVANLNADMKKYQMGALSISMLKFFHMFIWKDRALAQRMFFALDKAIGQLDAYHKFEEFEEPTKHAIRQLNINIMRMPYDEMRTEVIMLHNVLLHRRQLLSAEINALMDQIDSLYSGPETTKLLESLEPLDAFNDPNNAPIDIVYDILNNVLAPWKRIKGTLRGNFIRDTIKNIVRSHFPDFKYYDTRRTITTIDVPVESIPRLRARFGPDKTKPKKSETVNINRIDTRRDDLKNHFYNDNIKSMISFVKRINNERITKNWNTPYNKPLFNKQMKSNYNINKNKVLDNKNNNNKNVFTKKYYNEASNFFNIDNIKKSNPIRINFNNRPRTAAKPSNSRIMIITNTNQGKRNNVNKPRPLFRSETYDNYNGMINNPNNTQVQDVNQFNDDMYPDVPMVEPQPPSEFNVQIEGDKVNLQMDGDKKLIVINKNDGREEQFREDINLQMESSSAHRQRKHNRHHNKRHRRKHKHPYRLKHKHPHNLKHKLAEIKRIVRKYRAGHLKLKHRHHHRHHKHKERSLSIKLDSTSLPTTSNVPNKPTMKLPNDRRFQKVSNTTFRHLPAINVFTTQVYAVRNNLRRHMRIDNNDVNLLLESDASDEEIALRKKLYEAMSLGRAFRMGGGRRGGSRRSNGMKIVHESEGTDEEAMLKNNIYNYFNSIKTE